MPLAKSRTGRISVITLADRARDAGRWQEAAEYYRRALDRNPDNAPIWVQYGHTMKESGRLDQAKEAYLTAISCDPRVPDTYLQLGHLFKLQGRRADAEASYIRALMLDRSDGAPLDELTRLGWSAVDLTELTRVLIVVGGYGEPLRRSGVQ